MKCAEKSVFSPCYTVHNLTDGYFSLESANFRRNIMACAIYTMNEWKGKKLLMLPAAGTHFHASLTRKNSSITSVYSNFSAWMVVATRAYVFVVPFFFFVNELKSNVHCTCSMHRCPSPPFPTEYCRWQTSPVKRIDVFANWFWNKSKQKRTITGIKHILLQKRDGQPDSTRELWAKREKAKWMHIWMEFIAEAWILNIWLHAIYTLSSHCFFRPHVPHYKSLYGSGLSFLFP